MARFVCCTGEHDSNHPSITDFNSSSAKVRAQSNSDPSCRIKFVGDSYVYTTARAHSPDRLPASRTFEPGTPKQLVHNASLCHTIIYARTTSDV